MIFCRKDNIVMDKIAVLIPCYNEEQTIEKVVCDVKKALPEAVVYVYDNNSSDRTVELAGKAGAVIRYEYKQGKGNVIRRMFREIEAECKCLAWIHFPPVCPGIPLPHFPPAYCNSPHVWSFPFQFQILLKKQERFSQIHN